MKHLKYITTSRPFCCRNLMAKNIKKVKSLKVDHFYNGSNNTKFYPWYVFLYPSQLMYISLLYTNNVYCSCTKNHCRAIFNGKFIMTHYMIITKGMPRLKSIYTSREIIGPHSSILPINNILVQLFLKFRSN